MAAVRKNTLVVDFSVLPVRPEAAKVQKFLCEQIKLQLKDVETIQFHNIRNCVLIEMTTAELATQYQCGNNLRHVIIHEGRDFKIPVYLDDAAVTVRVHDLSTDIPHTTVKKHMEDHYGVVLSVGRERWKHYFPGIPNGIRVLRMHLSKPIPSYIEIEGQLTTVSYQNQVKSCRWCQKPAHPKQKCSEPTQEDAPTQQKESTATAQSTLFTVNDFPVLRGTTSTAAVALLPTQTPASVESHGADETIADTDQESAEVTDNKQDNDTDSSMGLGPDAKKQKRLSARLRNASKKAMCIPQGCQNDGGIVHDNSKNCSNVKNFANKSKSRLGG